jgi:hypothetical protein
MGGRLWTGGVKISSVLAFPFLARRRRANQAADKYALTFEHYGIRPTSTPLRHSATLSVKSSQPVKSAYSSTALYLVRLALSYL